jgi:hypothetical protein
MALSIVAMVFSCCLCVLANGFAIGDRYSQNNFGNFAISRQLASFKRPNSAEA